MSQSAAPFRHMLARPGVDMAELAADPDWSFEVKLDGIRVFVVWDGTRLRLVSRGGRDITAQFPELFASDPTDVKRLRPWCIDAELTAPGGLRAVLGRTNRRPPHLSMVGQGDGLAVPGLLDPALLNAFDVLQVDGALVTGVPLGERRRLLAELQLSILDDVAVKYVEAFHDGEDMLHYTQEIQGEGVMAKRLSSTYLQGRRSHSWLKFKHRYNVILIAYGYTASTSSTRPFGALQLAAVDGVVVRPVGEVGSGLSEPELTWFKEKIDRGDFPVVRVSCIGRTPQGLREPVFLGVSPVKPNDFRDAEYSQLARLPQL